MKESAEERYCADVLKIEVPMQMAHVEGTRAFKGESSTLAQKQWSLFAPKRR